MARKPWFVAPRFAVAMQFMVAAGFMLAMGLMGAGTARAQTSAVAATGAWSAWKPATSSNGAAASNIQYRWRSMPPCDTAGCHLSVELRNSGTAPAQFHYSVYFEAPSSQSKAATQPITGAASLKPSGDSPNGAAGPDTIVSQMATGLKIDRVVVEMKATSAGSDSWGPYHYQLLFAGNDLTPDATMSVNETLHIANGVLTITEVRDAASVDPARTPGLGTFTRTCTPQSARASAPRSDDGSGEPYIPAPLYEVQLTCAEGPTSALFMSEKDANAFVQFISNMKKS